MHEAWHGLRRNAKTAARALAARAFFLSPPKSGRTWLRVMLSHVWHLARGVPADRIVRFANFHRLAPEIPTILFTHLHNEPPPLRRLIAAATRLPGRRTLVLIRDPRDLAVSHYHHLRRRAKPTDLARWGIDRAGLERPLSDFLRDPRFGLPAQIARVNDMLEIARRARSALVVRYEELRRDPGSELARVLRFLGHEPDPDHVARAVAFAALPNLRRLEAEGFFRDEILRPADPRDPESFKVRRGVSGGWREEVPEGLRAWMEELVITRLDPEAGYGRREAGRRCAS